MKNKSFNKILLLSSLLLTCNSIALSSSIISQNQQNTSITLENYKDFYEGAVGKPLENNQFYSSDRIYKNQINIQDKVPSLSTITKSTMDLDENVASQLLPGCVYLKGQKIENYTFINNIRTITIEKTKVSFYNLDDTNLLINPKYLDKTILTNGYEVVLNNSLIDSNNHPITNKSFWYDTETNNFYYKIKVENNGDIIDNVYYSCTIKYNIQVSDGLYINKSFVNYDESNKNYFVYKKQLYYQKEYYYRINVELGNQIGNYIEVISDKLNNGNIVIKF